MLICFLRCYPRGFVQRLTTAFLRIPTRAAPWPRKSSMSTSRTRAIISALTVSSLWTHSLFPSASAKVVEAMQQVSALSLRRTCPPVIRSSDRCGCVGWEYRVSYLTGPVIRAHQFPLLVRHVTSKTTLAQTQAAIPAAAAAQCDTLHITWGRRSATGCVPPDFSPSLRGLTRPVRTY